MNKTTKVLSLATVMVAMMGMIGIGLDDAFAAKPGNGAGGVGQNGYQMNLIGMDTDSKLPNTKGNGHSMFVPLDGPYKILLSPGDFKITDRDATDGKGSFQLPDPNIDCGLDVTDGCVEDTADYYVYARVLGNPNATTDGWTAVTCAEEISLAILDGNGNGTVEKVCSLEEIDLESSNGKGNKAKFTNVTKQLLTLCLDTDADGSCDLRVDIFDERLTDYTWEMDNNGNRIVQLRFIDQPQNQ